MRHQLTPAPPLPPHLHIVASCTDRKRGGVSDALHLREVPLGPPRVRARAWWDRLALPHPKVPAGNVYVGEHWNLVRGLSTYVRQSGWTLDLWIASAGYGLLSEHDLITPYSATFSEGSPDQVAPDHLGLARHQYHQEWWSSLADIRSSSANPRSLAALAAQSPETCILVLASPDYIRALQEDLVLALLRLRRPERLAIITSDAAWSTSPLQESIVTVDSRTRTAWGGTMQGLHARSAHHLLAARGMLVEPFTARSLRDKYQDMVGDTPRTEKLNRSRMTDDEVNAFLRAELAKNPNAGWTLLLRVLRSGGQACEQRRFRNLHREISGNLPRLNLSKDSGE